MPFDDRAPDAELLARYARTGVAFTASGSAVLEVVLELLGIESGDEVVVPDVGCHSIAAAVVRRGAVPVFTGVGPALVLGPEDVLAAVSSRTRAVAAVHQYGLPCDVQAIIEALPREIAVVEDVAPTWGTRARGVVAGSAGVLAVTSFGASKPLSLGGGGAVLGPQEMLEGAVSYGDARDRSLSAPPSPARMPARLLDDLPAAIKTADTRLADRRAAVDAFLGSDLADHFRLPPHPPDSSFAWTRVPLYPVGPEWNEHVTRLLRALGQVQAMHALPPSGLPMFKDWTTRVVSGPGRPTEPLLVEIGQAAT